MKQLASMAIVLAAAVPLLACGNSSSSNGSGSSSGGGGTPTISITMPTANAMVAVTKPLDTVPITFSVTNFTLVMAGDPSCANASDNCGHIHLLVDGQACTPDGAPYNNDGIAPTPVNAILSSCPTVNGMHTVTLELHHNDHSPVLNAAMTGAISTQVAFTATGG